MPALKEAVPELLGRQKAPGSHLSEAALGRQKAPGTNSSEGALGRQKAPGSHSAEAALSLKMLQDELQALTRELTERIKSDMQDLLDHRPRSSKRERILERPISAGETLATRVSDIGPVGGVELLDAWDDGTEFSFSQNLKTFGCALQIGEEDLHGDHEPRSGRRRNDPGRAPGAARYQPREKVESLDEIASAQHAAALKDKYRDREKKVDHQSKELKVKRERSKKDREEKTEKSVGDRRPKRKKEKAETEAHLDAEVQKEAETGEVFETRLMTAMDAKNSPPIAELDPVKEAHVIGSPASHDTSAPDESVDTALVEKSVTYIAPEKAGLKVVVKHHYFDYVFAMLVLINTLLIGLQIQVMAVDKKWESPLWCRTLELFFTSCFTMEILLRVYVDAFGFFVSSNKLKLWNFFDCLAVIVQIAEQVLMCFTNDHTHLAFIIMRVVRIVRAVRVLRRPSITSRSGELNTLVASLTGSVKAFLLACVVMFIIVYIFAVFLTYLVLDHFSDATNSVAQGVENKLDKYYGSLAVSVLTLFQTISGGCDWGDALKPLYDDISPQMSILFSIYIAFVVFAVMNVITGVFVEAALDNAKKERDSVMLTMVRNFMQSILLDRQETKDATVTYEKFKAHLNDDWMQRYFKSIDLDVSEAKGLFSLLDIEGTGEVLAEDFLSGCMALRGSARSLDLRIVRYESKRFQRKVERHGRAVERHLANLNACFQDVLEKLNLTT